MRKEHKLFEEAEQNEVKEQVAEETDETVSTESENQVPVGEPSSLPRVGIAPYHERYYLKYRKRRSRKLCDVFCSLPFCFDLAFHSFHIPFRSLEAVDHQNFQNRNRNQNLL